MYSPTGSVPPPSHLTSCTPTRSNLYLAGSLNSLGSPPYTNSLHSIIGISYSYSVACVIYRKNPSMSEALLRFRNKLICVRCRVVSPTPNPQTEEPSFMGCPRLLIEYICNYSVAGGRSSICNLRTRLAVVTGTPPDMAITYYKETNMSLIVPQGILRALS
jgi:hypothetical protein